MKPAGSYDVIIIGGGIAGASLASFLADHGIGDVLILERESQLAVHSTGRSAASISAFDGNDVVLDLKILGSRFWRNPPTGLFADAPLNPLGVLSLFAAEGFAALEERETELRARGLEFDLLSAAACREKMPVLEAAGLAGGLFIGHDGRLDVHGILQGYLRHARAAGAELVLGAEVSGILREGPRVVGVRLPQGDVRAELVVNAAGAWAGRIGAMAEASPIQFQPKRRTLFTFPGPPDTDFRDWPMVWSDPHDVYFLPEAGELMLSPMDQVPMQPCDPNPDEETIAAAIERLRELAPSLVPRTIRSRWSGLRTFAPDDAHVIGNDPQRPGFFWLAGQGGAGIETSPAYARIGAELIASGSTSCFDAARLAPERFAKG
jgi:D-arginine dehydrogenase